MTAFKRSQAKYVKGSYKVTNWPEYEAGLRRLCRSHSSRDRSRHSYGTCCLHNSCHGESGRVTRADKARAYAIARGELRRVRCGG